MNILEAFASGKPFKRKHWTMAWSIEDFDAETLIEMHIEDLTADDWVTCELGS